MKVFFDGSEKYGNASRIEGEMTDDRYLPEFSPTYFSGATRRVLKDIGSKSADFSLIELRKRTLLHETGGRPSLMKEQLSVQELANRITEIIGRIPNNHDYSEILKAMDENEEDNSFLSEYRECQDVRDYIKSLDQAESVSVLRALFNSYIDKGNTTLSSFKDPATLTVLGWFPINDVLTVLKEAVEQTMNDSDTKKMMRY